MLRSQSIRASTKDWGTVAGVTNPHHPISVADGDDVMLRRRTLVREPNRVSVFDLEMNDSISPLHSTEG